MYKKHLLKEVPFSTRKGIRMLSWRLVRIGAVLFMPILFTSFTAHAQDDRLRTNPTAWWWYHGASAKFINQILKEKGARIIDIEVEQASPYRFTVVMVKNQGAYGRAWWWYYGIKGVGGVATKVKQHSHARLIDVEAVEVKYGDGKGPQFTVVLVDNTGSQAKPWWRSYNDPMNFVSSKLKKHKARLIDLDANRFSIAPHYSAVMIANQGADSKAWWWYVNVSPDFITSKLKENNARLVDIEWNGGGRLNVIMVRSSGEFWWWYYGLSADGLAKRVQQHSARIIDIETYRVGGQKRFAAIMVKPDKFKLFKSKPDFKFQKKK